jgi:hypothetical protein
MLPQDADEVSRQEWLVHGMHCCRFVARSLLQQVAAGLLVNQGPSKESCKETAGAFLNVCNPPYSAAAACISLPTTCYETSEACFSWRAVRVLSFLLLRPLFLQDPQHQKAPTTQAAAAAAGTASSSSNRSAMHTDMTAATSAAVAAADTQVLLQAIPLIIIISSRRMVVAAAAPQQLVANAAGGRLDPKHLQQPPKQQQQQQGGQVPADQAR